MCVPLCVCVLPSVPLSVCLCPSFLGFLLLFPSVPICPSVSFWPHPAPIPAHLWLSQCLHTEPFPALVINRALEKATPGPNTLAPPSARGLSSDPVRPSHATQQPSRWAVLQLGSGSPGPEWAEPGFRPRLEGLHERAPQDLCPKLGWPSRRFHPSPELWGAWEGLSCSPGFRQPLLSGRSASYSLPS